MSIELFDWSEEEISAIEGIVLKSSEKWKSQYKLVKAVLASRPNIE